MNRCWTLEQGTENELLFLKIKVELNFLKSLNNLLLFATFNYMLCLFVNPELTTTLFFKCFPLRKDLRFKWRMTHTLTFMDLFILMITWDVSWHFECLKVIFPKVSFSLLMVTVTYQFATSPEKKKIIILMCDFLSPRFCRFALSFSGLIVIVSCRFTLMLHYLVKTQKNRQLLATFSTTRQL